MARAFFQSESAAYFIAQKYEPVLELRIVECSLRIGTEAARIGWMIGNLHFQIQITEDAIRVADDTALRQLFERERISFVACKRVFQPLRGAHHH